MPPMPSALAASAPAAVAVAAPPAPGRPGARPIDVALRELEPLAREVGDAARHRERLLALVLVDRGRSRRGRAEVAVEVDADALRLGDPRARVRADPAAVAGDDVARDRELPVGVVDRVRTWSSGGMGRAARSRAVAMAASSPVLASRSRVSSANGSVFTPAGGSAASAPRARRRRSRPRAPRVRARRDEVAAGVLDDGGERRLGAQRLDLERLDRVDEGRGAPRRLGGRLEREVRLLALSRLAPARGEPALCSANFSSCSASSAFSGDLPQASSE